jgi:hypothetical protein
VVCDTFWVLAKTASFLANQPCSINSPYCAEVSMHVTVVALFSLALLLTVVALAREVRLRRSLQRLLRWVLNRWKGGTDEIRSLRDDHPDDRDRLRL